MKSRCYVLIVLLLFASDILATLSCYSLKEECAEDRAIRMFGDNKDIPLSLPCWKKKVTYECRESTDDNCQKLRNDECEHISAKCRPSINGVCVVQDEIYRCPVKSCDIREKIVCAKDLFCLDGKCAPTKSVVATDEQLGKGVTYLSVLNQAAQELKDKGVGISDKEVARNIKIFSGKSMECKRYVANAKNCCGGKGWLMPGCDSEDKAVGAAKEDGRAIEIGEYCHNKQVGVCTSYHTAYCVFDSKLAKVIQHEGRQKQLGISFGSVGDDYAHLDCRGIIADELSHIDFSKINFSEFEKEFTEQAKKYLPKEEDLKTKAKSYIYEDLKNKNVRGNAQEVSDQKIEYRAVGRINEFYERTKK